jgi:PAS domain S-box-containing protein
LIWAGLYFFVQNERQQALDAAVQQATGYSRAFEEHILRTIRGLDQIVLFLKYQVEKDGWNLDVPRLIAEKRFEGQPFVQLGVANANGDVVANNIVPFVKANVRDRDHFTAHQASDTKKLFISRPVVARVSGKWSIQLSRRINNPDGSFGGIALSSIDPYYLADFYKLVNLGKHSSIALIGRDGFVRVWQVDSTLGVGEDLRQNPLMKVISAGGAGTYAVQSPIDGVNRIYCYRELPEYPLLVAVGVSEEQVYLDLNQRLVAYYWFAGAMSVVVCLFVGVSLLIISRRRQNEVQVVLREIAEIAVSAPSLDELYAKIHQSVSKVLPVENFFVAMLDPANRDIVVEYCVDETQSMPRRRPYGKGFTEYILRQQRVVFLTAADFATLAQAGEIDLQFMPGGECLGAPLRSAAGELLGVIVVFSIRATTLIKPEDTALMATIAAQVSMAIEWKRTEQALHYSRVRYRTIMDQSFEALAVIEINNQEVVEVNQRFTELFGYSLPQDAPLYVNRFVIDSQNNLDRYYNETLKQRNVLPTEVRHFRHKNGRDVFVERAGTLIHVEGREIYLASMRDITAEHYRQAALERDIEVASRLQQGLLPELPESPWVDVRTIYRPLRFVSGDSYHLEWCNGGKLLRGFLLDVSGHGLATAIQTASVNVLLREASKSNLPLLGQLRRINARSEKYFTDDSYVAMLGFELDLLARELRYVGAGITQFYANGKIIETPGMFVGMWRDVDFTMNVLPIAVGDRFFFLTDGFTDAMNRAENDELSPVGNDFNAIVAALERLATEGTLRDDATAICLQIKKIE